MQLHTNNGYKRSLSSLVDQTTDLSLAVKQSPLLDSVYTLHISIPLFMVQIEQHDVPEEDFRILDV